MSLQSRLQKQIRIAAKKFNGVHRFIDPTVHKDGEGGNYPERMFSYYYIQAIAAALKPATVLLELPVTGKNKRRMDNHVDALIFNDKEMVVAEFKLGWAQSHWDALARDLRRLRGSVALEIQNKFIDKQRRRAWIFLGADCYRQSVAEVWKSGISLNKRILPCALGKSDFRDYERVWKDVGTGFDGHYLTWALLPYDEMKWR